MLPRNSKLLLSLPEDLVHRTKWEIGLELHQVALANGVRFAWLTADEFYFHGGEPGGPFTSFPQAAAGAGRISTCFGGP